jgi:hypothetical protein
MRTQEEIERMLQALEDIEIKEEIKRAEIYWAWYDLRVAIGEAMGLYLLIDQIERIAKKLLGRKG